MKFGYINNNFDYKNKIKVFKNSPIKKIIALSLIASLTLTGCSMYNNTNNSTTEPTVIENVQVPSGDVQSSSQQSPTPNVTGSIAKPVSSSTDIVTDKPEAVASEEKPAVVSEPVKQQEKKLVAITFDDGPSKYTSDLVDILTANGVNATFFLIGRNISNYSDAVVKCYQAGNEIGIHTYSHTSFTKMSIEQIQNELNKTRALLDGIDVDYSNIVRPPYGDINKSIQDNINTSFILWSVDTRDWESKNKDAVIAQVKANISEGSIILFHDIYPSTIEAIKEVLPELTNEYEFVTVSELFNQNNKSLDENQKYYKVKK